MPSAIILTILVIGLLNILLTAALLLRLGSRRHDQAEKAVRDELRLGREESSRMARELREEVTANLTSIADTNVKIMSEAGSQQKSQLEAVARQLKELTDSNQARIDSLRTTIDNQLHQLLETNERKLEEMRKTVDEKLQDTLHKRLGESFKLVSERLEAVQRGLGEMQNLATGVGDLKRVLSNVKVRGTWGEFQLAAILEQVLTPDQYAKNVQPKEGSRDVVEFAIRLPGPDAAANSCVWLPIDSKFPQEDYLRLLEASEAGDPEAVAKATTALNRAVRVSAQDIHDKYLNPPSTTDFGIMFLPTEGLYAEILRQPSLIEELQQKFRVVTAGPTTLAAILNSLRMGFRTLAIEKRASEVWVTLAAVKTEFGKFGDTLAKVRKQLDAARKSIDDTSTRTRQMERKLREVEQLPSEQAAGILGMPAGLMLEEVAEEVLSVSGED